MKKLTDFSEECQALFEHVAAPLMLINELGGSIIGINKAAIELFEFDGVEVLGKSTIDLGIWIQPQVRSRLMHVIARIGQIEKHTVRMRTRTGRGLTIALSIKAVTVSGVNCFLASYVDITWQEQLADKLRVSQNQLAMRHSGTLAGSWTFDHASDLLFLSERAHTMLDPVSTQDPRVGLPARALIHTKDLDKFHAAVRALNIEKNAVDVSVRLHTGKGQHRWFRLWNSLPGAPGEMEDIHSYKVLELARLREAKKAALATTAAEMGTWETFADGTAVWDPQTYRLYGYDPGTTVLPHDIFRAVQTAAGHTKTSRWLGKSLKHGLALYIEFEIRWPDGQVRWLASQGGISPASENAQPTLLGVAWDITDQRRAKHMLEKHQQELSGLTLQLLEQEKQTSNKLALALHDQIGQTLTAARLMLDVQMGEQPSESGRKISLLLGQAMQQVRNLLIDLRPPMLEENGLYAALQNEIERVLPQGLSCDITLDITDDFESQRWPSRVEYAFFMIAREAISNALGHANPDLIQVFFRADANVLVMEIVDDGDGFEVNLNDTRPGHLGMVSMRERASAIGARLSFSSLVGDGTRVKLMWTDSI